jgi:hypothetical protein
MVADQDTLEQFVIRCPSCDQPLTGEESVCPSCDAAVDAICNASYTPPRGRFARALMWLVLVLFCGSMLGAAAVILWRSLA